MASPTLSMKIQMDAKNRAKAAIKSFQDDVKGATGGLNKATEAQKRSEAAAAKAAATMKTFAKAALAVGAALAFASKLKDFASEIATMGDHIGKGAKQLGLTTDEFQRLDHALKISGTGIDEQAGAFRRFAKTARDANSGVKLAKDAFDRLGVSVVDGLGDFKDTRTLLGDVATAFKGLTSDVERSAVAQDLFGRSGAKMMPFLDLGEEGIAALGDEVQRLGGVMASDGVQRAEEMKDSLERLDAVTRGWKITLADDVVPVLNEYLEIWLKIVRGDGSPKNFGKELMELGDQYLSNGKLMNSLGDQAQKNATQVGKLRKEFLKLPLEAQIAENARLMIQVAGLPPHYRKLVNAISGYRDHMLAAADAARELASAEKDRIFVATALRAIGTEGLAAALAELEVKEKIKKLPRARKDKTEGHDDAFERLTKEEFARDNVLAGLRTELALLQDKTDAEKEALRIQQGLRDIQVAVLNGMPETHAALQREILLLKEKNAVTEEVEAGSKGLTKAQRDTWDMSLAAAQGAGGIAKIWVDSKVPVALFEGGMEMAYAAKSFANSDPVGAVAHGFAAAQFFALAGQAAAGGGKGGGGGEKGATQTNFKGSADSAFNDAKKSGAGNTIIQLGGPISSQDVARGVKAAMRSAYGTGNMGGAI